MSHHVIIQNAILDFKNKTSPSSGIVRRVDLSAILCVAMAYTLPLPDNGTHGARDAYQAVGGRVVNSIVSEVNELVHLDTGAVIELTRSVYENRYEMVYSPELGIQAPSVREIVKAVFCPEEDTAMGELAAIIEMWTPRFLTVCKAYYADYDKEAA